MGKASKFLWTILLTCLLTSQAWAYRVIDVKSGGTIQGRAVLSGDMPEKRRFHLILFPNLDMCAEIDVDENLNRVLDDFKIGPNNGLKDVVISLEYVEAGKPFPENPIHILSKNCKFTPDVHVIQQDGLFTIDNVDGVMHNSQVYQSGRGKILLNIPIPPDDISHGSVHFLKKYKIMQMICGMHEFMQTWAFRVQNPYNFITDTDGAFKINSIPPGDYVVTAWHYLMKPQTQKIHIDPDSSITVDFDFSGNEVVRPLYETIKSGRISEDAAVPGTLRHQELSGSGMEGAGKSSGGK